MNTTATGSPVERSSDVVVSTVAVAAVAVAVGVVAIACLSNEPLAAVEAFLTGPFDGRVRTGTTLSRAIPYMFTGAALAISFRAGVFNIGAEGQLFMGALAGTVVAVEMPGPGPVVILASCLAGALAGGLWAGIPGFLRARYDASEVVLTLMMNFMAIQLVSWMLSGPIADPDSPGYPQSRTLDESVRLGRLLRPSTLHLGLVIGIVLCLAGAWLLRRSTPGFSLRTTGDNPEFARYVGLRPRLTVFNAMALSGAIAGLAGIVHVMGDLTRLVEGFSPGYGFVGILIALLARNNLAAVPLAAGFYAWLISGAQVMEEQTDVPREVVSVIQGVLFLLVTATFLLAWMRRRRARREARPAPAPVTTGAPS